MRDILPRVFPCASPGERPGTPASTFPEGWGFPSREPDKWHLVECMAFGRGSVPAPVALTSARHPARSQGLPPGQFEGLPNRTCQALGRTVGQVPTGK